MIALISLIILAELLIFLEYMRAAMVIHASNLILIIILNYFINNRTYPILLQLPLFRLLNVAMSVFFQLTLYSYSLVYAPMFKPIYFIMKNGLLSRFEAGITFKCFWFYLPMAVVVGFALGWGENMVLRSGLLVPDSSTDFISYLRLSRGMIRGGLSSHFFHRRL